MNQPLFALHWAHIVQLCAAEVRTALCAAQETLPMPHAERIGLDSGAAGTGV